MTEPIRTGVTRAELLAVSSALSRLDLSAQVRAVLGAAFAETVAELNEDEGVGDVTDIVLARARRRQALIDLASAPEEIDPERPPTMREIVRAHGQMREEESWWLAALILAVDSVVPADDIPYAQFRSLLRTTHMDRGLDRANAAEIQRLIQHNLDGRPEPDLSADDIRRRIRDGDWYLPTEQTRGRRSAPQDWARALALGDYRLMRDVLQVAHCKERPALALAVWTQARHETSDLTSVEGQLALVEHVFAQVQRISQAHESAE